MNNKLIIIYLCLLSTTQLASKNILLLTLPKTGTNLVLKLLKKISGKNMLLNVNGLMHMNIENLNDFICWGHEWEVSSLDPRGKIEPSPEKIAILKKLDVKLILLLRDPREHVVSLLRAVNKPINYFTLNTGIIYFPNALYRATDTESFLQYKNINEIYKNYLKWQKDYPDVYLTYFEKLVGLKGGGSLKAQFDEIKKICNFLDIQISDSEINTIASNLFGDTYTFREGKIDSWKNYYSKDNKVWFKHRSKNLLYELKYEKNDSW